MKIKKYYFSIPHSELKPLLHINMLKEKNLAFKLKNRQLEEENAKLRNENQKLKQEKEYADARVTFGEKEIARVKRNCDQEVSELKQKLFKAEYELSQLKKTSVAPVQIETTPTIELNSSDDEMEQEEEQPNIQEFNFDNKHKWFSCGICSKTYIQEKRYRNHLKTHGNVNQNPSPVANVQRGGKCTIQYRCEVPGCKFKCPYYPTFNRHVKSHSLPTLECEIDGCNYTTPYEKRLSNHVANKHAGEGIMNMYGEEQFSLTHENGDRISKIEHF